ncbi:hypothetical protein [Agrilutibacter solisilvae]|uniref:DUF1440 domain-containing protein n=1 Tax=Agrilutibacter solisilvae TaxID=2763317 RepID=A0A975ASE8_9GAMM|nr:hypothetical protein [Lysobacter solisilvae]QSX78667.1 hypothetical protein I8J32_001620 [Lysobacter solisilvae]
MVGGGLAGTFDIAYAISFAAWRGMPPEKLLQLVASGLLGSAAYDGGWNTALLGLGLHFLISLAAAAVFYTVARRWLPVLRTHPIEAGLAFGLGMFALMNFIVLPLSAFPHPVRFTALATGTNLASHLFLFGLPIALATRRALGRG